MNRLIQNNDPGPPGLGDGRAGTPAQQARRTRSTVALTTLADPTAPGAGARPLTRGASSRPDGTKSGAQAPRSAVLGIDPGLDGGVALILPGRAEAYITPTITVGRSAKRHFDIAGMIALLEAYPVELAVIEAVSAMPGQGVASTFHFGEGFGLWQGMLAKGRIPYQLVTPPAWKRLVLAGTARDKAAGIQFAQRRFPGVSLLATPRSRVHHTGLADALCLAEFGRRHLLGADR